MSWFFCILAAYIYIAIGLAHNIEQKCERNCCVYTGYETLLWLCGIKCLRKDSDYQCH